MSETLVDALEALVRLFARQYPARFEILAREEIAAAWRRALQEPDHA